ncbi:MAG TPA: hypothetical protein VGE70_04230 [Burkholderiaceae bacterium]
MKRLVLVGAVLAATVLSGCVVYPHGGGRHYHSQPGYDGGGPGPRAYRDRDRDGVPNRYDRRPGNPYRY